VEAKASPDITGSEFKASAYGFYEKLRKTAPVYAARLPDGQTAWLITRYDDVNRALKDERLFKDKRKLSKRAGLSLPWFLRALEAVERNMLDSDPPDHGRLRGLVHKGFTPRRIDEMAARIERLADELLAKADASGPIDLIRDYALPIPSTIIAEMLGIPAEDQIRFHRWSSAIVAVSAKRSLWSALPTLFQLFRFLRYLQTIIASKRNEPSDDLITALVQGQEASDRLSEEEVLAMVFLLVVAGHETTVNLIGNGALALLQHPEERERLRADPGLYGSAIEELLRFHGPVEVATERYARVPLEVAGAVIPEHALVYLVLASANRDESRFERPDELDVAREPNRHLAFGDGIHFCLGAPLARLEGRIALERLFSRFPDLRLAVPPDQLRWNPGLNLRGLRELPVAR
jgi:cytochrome P450 PksS